MSSRFNKILGSRRRNQQQTPGSTGSPAPPASTPSASSLTTPPNVANSSSTSLPAQQTSPGQMNPNQLGRPPSYSYAAPGQQLGAPPHAGRPHSPMPPPINTGTQQPGYPPQQMYGPPGGGPPNYGQQPGGYGAAYGQPQPQAPVPAQYRPPGAVAEVDGGARSKAQLIVGIDFVRNGC
jgi:hypothetical protein